MLVALAALGGALAARPTSRARAIAAVIGAGLCTLVALPTMLEGAYPSRPAPAGVVFHLAIALVGAAVVYALVTARRSPLRGP